MTVYQIKENLLQGTDATPSEKVALLNTDNVQELELIISQISGRLSEKLIQEDNTSEEDMDISDIHWLFNM